MEIIPLTDNPARSAPPSLAMRPVATAAALLFVSGLCALVFQTAWFREFRLIFGSTTPAAAAVLAIFMGGLGLGNAVLGRRADRAANPLALYAQLELAISVLTAASPWLLQIARSIYLALGGQETLGSVGAAVIRLLLAALVIGLPAVLMGGTLPAVARAVTASDDPGRRSVGWLYGCNTFGAVAGALASTFVLLELLGTRQTLWLAAAINMANGATAWFVSRHSSLPLAAEAPSAADRADALGKDKRRQAARSLPAHAELPHSEDDVPVAQRRLLYAAAATVGFAFFLMELVWYRMLAPILGGTTFTFGLILAVALAGIAIGGALYPLVFRQRVPTLRDLALTCGWEAAAIALPFALGDRLAITALVLRDLAYFGFAGQVLGWALVTLVVVGPAAMISGLQFPLLVALLGRGGQHVGKHVGLAYAWNTAGAMAGSLAGGFGLLSLLTAPGAWKLGAWLPAVLAIVVLLFAMRSEKLRAGALHPLLATALAVAFLWSVGPTALWRHTGIGAGRAKLPDSLLQNDLRRWRHQQQHNLLWEAEGQEASVAVHARHGLAFIVNGKIDGNALIDAPTQIMFPVLGALLHPRAEDSLVIGLGTGESAGWLASLPEIKRVDVVELEPVIAEVADQCAAFNHDALRHSKVRVVYNDAREFVQTTRHSYDLIISEPSNPYRAGVASLYTDEFYRQVRRRLNPEGMFLQWVQAYEVDMPTVRMCAATLRRTFNHAELWQTKTGDLVFVCSEQPLTYDLARLESRLQVPEYRQALLAGWRTTTLEGVLAHFVASDRFLALMAAQPDTPINTDDRNQLEYRFARTVGRQVGTVVQQLHHEARARGLDHPPQLASAVDWQLVRRQTLAYSAVLSESPYDTGDATGDEARLAAAWKHYLAGDYRAFVDMWNQAPTPPHDVLETTALAYALVSLGRAEAAALIESLRADAPADAALLAAVLALRQERREAAATLLPQALEMLRSDPTVHQRIGELALRSVAELVEADSAIAGRLEQALSQPFVVRAFDASRKLMRCHVAQRIDAVTAAQALVEMEPFVPWDGEVLALRLKTYSQAGSPLAIQAEEDLLAFLRWSPESAAILKD